MIQLSLVKTIMPMKSEAMIVLGVIGLLFVLPFIAIISMGTDLVALSKSEVKLYTGPASTTNTYAFGYCTFWAAKRREEVGKPIPNDWGDAHTWDDRSMAAGYIVDHIPIVNAIMETDAGDLGHVAFVESVSPDGIWIISEMNAPNWDVISGRTFKAADAMNYKFIH